MAPLEAELSCHKALPEQNGSILEVIIGLEAEAAFRKEMAKELQQGPKSSRAWPGCPIASPVPYA